MTAQTQLVRDQHIVPQWHLKKFADVDGWLWRYKQNKPVKKSRPKSECWGRDFYEYDVNGKRTENTYERWLSGIENDAAPILETLVNRQQLTQQETIAWAYYVASLFLRTQKVRSQFSARMVQKFKEQTQSPGFIRSLQYDLLKEGELVPAQDLRKQIEQLRGSMESSPTQPSFSASIPRMVTDIPPILSTRLSSSGYDVSPDGQRFLFVKANMKNAPLDEVRVVLNWTEELKRLAPPAKKP